MRGRVQTKNSDVEKFLGGVASSSFGSNAEAESKAKIALAMNGTALIATALCQELVAVIVQCTGWNTYIGLMCGLCRLCSFLSYKESIKPLQGNSVYFVLD